MSKNLVWFNKEGDCLNITYNETTERYEGDLLFHENSSDTFKTIGLYLFENIPSFEYEVPGVLGLDKFQLFNEHGFNFVGNAYFTQSVTKIEAINDDSDFFSKWIYGEDFEKKYPIGSQIIFNQQFLEFTNLNQSYTIISTKKGAVMIISNVDNKTFNNNFSGIAGLTTSYTNITISGANTFGVYNYIEPNLNSKISSWSEPDFYLKYFPGKKLNLINTKNNDKVVTVKNNQLLDRVYYKSYTDGSTLTQSSTLIAELILKSDLPMIYSGNLTIQNDKILFGSLAPVVLRPGIQMSISGSLLNQNFITIDSIVPFYNGMPDTFYATQSQVIYNNQVWQCIQSYTQSATSSITPDDINYWSDNITYLPVVENLIPESVSSAQIYLTTNRFYYTYGWTQSNTVTLASFADKYKSDFDVFNINLYYNTKNKTLNSDLIYPSKYAEVNFYSDIISATNSITSLQTKLENQILVEEILNTELNRDFSERWNYNIVFTDIDEFGIKVNINGMLYQEEVKWVYNGLSIDLIRTVDKTLRSWLSKYYVRLFTLGVIAKLQYLGNGFSVYYNAINLTTQYPNVPIQFDVQVGTTADFHIQDSSVIFYDMGIYFEATINGDVFGLPASTIVVGTQSIYDVPSTLSNWVDEYQFILDDYGIYVSSVNNSLIFNTKSQEQVVNYSFRIGKSSLPGETPFEIRKRYSGNIGSLVTSNSMVLQSDPNLLTSATNSFLDAGFATGMVVTVNNTLYPWNNQQYNILYVDGNNINFSYQGPFWATDEPFCDSSPFTTIAFSLGFGATGCEPPPVPPTGGGEFDIDEFSPSFSLQYQSNNTYNQELYSGTLYMQDLIYTQISESIYVLGGNLLSLNASTGQIKSTIFLSGTQSVCLRYNKFNNYLYALTKDQIYVVDPVIDSIIATMSLPIGSSPYDCQINSQNGDIYVSYSNLPQVDIWSSSNILNSSVTLSDVGYSLAFNEVDFDMYVEQNDSIVSQIKGSTRLITSTYSISGLTHSLIYEPSDSSIIAFGTNLTKINAGTIISFDTLSGDVFNYSIFDNLNNNIVLSISSTSSTIIQSIDSNGTQSWSKLSVNYGYLVMNQFDGDIYMASQVSDKVVVIDSITGQIKHTESFNSKISKMIFNPARNSIWGIKSDTNQVVEIGVNLGSSILVEPDFATASFYEQYGTLDSNYKPKEYLWIKTDPYIRYPRQNYTFDNSKIKYVYKWLTDQTPEMFMYDFSGLQLSTTGDLAYVGEKPLPIVSLNRTINKNPDLVSYSEYQQTIFGEISNELDYIDSETNLTFLPKPLELFLGYNSNEEGTTTSTLQLLERENISLTFTPSISNNNFITFTFVEDLKSYGVISLNVNSNDNFLFDTLGKKTGLRVGQHIKIMISDITNTRNKFISFNNAKIFKIREIYTRQIVVDFISDLITNETNVISDYPKVGNTTYLRVIIKTIDKEIGRFNVFGQTEIEDERYRIELSNTGQLISSDNVYIFKEYDINEQGIDWTYLNKKRKEMLLVRSDIYPYVGSYKAIINAINYFGYNDLHLYEYYRNINSNSPDYQKLFKIEIPDIFDNSVEGWTENDFIKHTLPNANFSDTNLFNLTYRITDFEGNNLLFYSLREVLIKLQGLKYWLQSNVIPITHRILDITGRADFIGVNTIIHKSYDTKIINIKQNLSPVDFKANEAYLMPINSGSTVYNVVLDFFVATSSVLPDYFNLTIRTYQTYNEWDPFTTYNLGDRVIYYQQLYESDINNNKINNPRKYEYVLSWSSAVIYNPGEFTNYKDKIYQYIGLTNSTIGVNPILDSEWLDITQWRKIDYTPVQTIKEFRTGTQSFNFAVDTNLDPFITIEVTSDNGYGQIYSSKKNYELRGLNDLSRNVMIINADPLPTRFTPLTPPPTPPITTTTTLAPVTTTTTTIPASTTTTTTSFVCSDSVRSILIASNGYSAVGRQGMIYSSPNNKAYVLDGNLDVKSFIPNSTILTNEFSWPSSSLLLGYNSNNNKIYTWGTSFPIPIYVRNLNTNITSTISIPSVSTGMGKIEYNSFLNKIYAFSQTSGFTTAQIHIIDGVTDTLTNQITGISLSNVHATIYNPNNNKLYFAQGGRIYTCVGNNITQDIPTLPITNASIIAINISSNIIYLVDSTTVYRVNVSTNTTISSVPILGIGWNPTQLRSMIYNPDNGKLYISRYSSTTDGFLGSLDPLTGQFKLIIPNSGVSQPLYVPTNTIYTINGIALYEICGS